MALQRAYEIRPTMYFKFQNKLREEIDQTKTNYVKNLMKTFKIKTENSGTS